MCYLPGHAGVKSDFFISHQRDKICAERGHLFLISDTANTGQAFCAHNPYFRL